jgi:CubicO group peptidase (beta-lactamase class C family)
VDPVRLNAAVDYMNREFGPDGAKELVIVRNGYLIWEGPQAGAYHPIWSCSKTFTSTVLGLLIDDGRCTLDTRAVEREVHLADQYSLYSRITLRHLASMCGGYRGEVKDVRNDQPWGDPMAFLNPREPYFEAGAAVQYNDHDVFLLGKILTLLSGEPLQDIFQQRIAGPIGMTRWEWGVSGTVNGIALNNPPGNPGGAAAGGVKTTARELARFGLLYLNRGNWNGRQLLSTSFVDQATTNQVPTSAKYRNHDFRGRYGFYWWVNGTMASGNRPWPSAPPKTYTAHGRGCNFCFVIPEWSMVVVRLGTVPISTGNIAKGDRLCDGFFRRLAFAVAGR